MLPISSCSKCFHKHNYVDDTVNALYDVDILLSILGKNLIGVFVYKSIDHVKKKSEKPMLYFGPFLAFFINTRINTVFLFKHQVRTIFGTVNTRPSKTEKYLR